MKSRPTIFAAIFFVAAFSLTAATSAQDAAPAVLPGDPLFERGLSIHGRRHGDPVRQVDADGREISGNQEKTGARPLWSVAQWHSRGGLDRRKLDGNRVTLYDDFKSLTLDRKTGAFTMNVAGSKEYAEGPRRDVATPWVHLLLSQESGTKTPMLHMLETLTVELEFELTEFRSVLEKPSPLYAAQFQVFLYLRSVDRDKPERYTDFTWFGISMFDNRTDFTDDYAAQDFAETQGRFIYTIGSKHTLTEKVEVGKRMKIEVDLIPHVRKCLDAAHEKGFMKDVRFEDTLFDGMNIGWEVPGVFDCGMTVHEFRITPRPHKPRSGDAE